MTSQLSLQARWVVPVEGSPIAGGVITIADGKITAVEKHTTDPVEDLGDVILMPGLVNSHTHLEFSNLEQPLGLPGMSLPDWIRLVIANRQHAKRNPRQAISAGLQQSCQLGVSTIGDIATENVSATTPDQPQVLGFQEVIGFSAARSDSALAEVDQRLSASVGPSGISPHAPYTVHPTLLNRLIDLACRKNLPVAMHLAESTEELELLAEGKGAFQQLLDERSMWDSEAIALGSKPIDYLKVLAQAPRAIVVHGNYLDAEDIEYLAKQNRHMSVAFCPRTHAFFRHSAYPLQQMLAAGVRISLGTDSRASNPGLSLLGEMRYVAEHHQGIPLEQILRMGTLSGAEALGMARATGSITVGKQANLIAVRYDSSIQSPIEALLSGNELPCRTWIRGELVSSTL